MATPDRPPPAAGNAPDRQLAGIRHVDVPEVELTAELVERREAVAELGEALRELTLQAIGSEVAVDVLRRVADDARELVVALAERQRRPDELSSVDDLRRGQRPFNPVVGLGNPVAPPMRVELVDGVATGSCNLDWRYEGPFTFAHGTDRRLPVGLLSPESRGPVSADRRLRVAFGGSLGQHVGMLELRARRTMNRR